MGNIHQLSRNVKITQIIHPASFGAGANNSAAIDMQGYDGVLFIANVGLIAATGTLAGKCQYDTVSNFASPEDIAGSAMVAFADTDDNKMLLWDLSGDFDQQYVRLVLTTAVAASLLGATAIQYRRNSGKVNPIALSGGGAQLILRPDPVVGTA